MTELPTSLYEARRGPLPPHRPDARPLGPRLPARRAARRAARARRRARGRDRPRPGRPPRLRHPAAGPARAPPHRDAHAAARAATSSRSRRCCSTTASGDALMRLSAWRLRREELELPAGIGEPDPPPRPRAEGGISLPAFWTEPVAYHAALDWRFVDGDFDEPGPATAGRACVCRSWPARSPRRSSACWSWPTRPAASATCSTGRAGCSSTSSSGSTSSGSREGEWMAMDAVTRLGPDGAGLCTSVLSDERGRVGVSTQTLRVPAARPQTSGPVRRGLPSAGSSVTESLGKRLGIRRGQQPDLAATRLVGMERARRDAVRAASRVVPRHEPQLVEAVRARVAQAARCQALPRGRPASPARSPFTSTRSPRRAAQLHALPSASPHDQDRGGGRGRQRRRAATRHSQRAAPAGARSSRAEHARLEPCRNVERRRHALQQLRAPLAARQHRAAASRSPRRCASKRRASSSSSSPMPRRRGPGAQPSSKPRSRSASRSARSA